MSLMFVGKEKKMTVACDFVFCVYNYNHECSLDKIRICHGGACDMAVNRMHVRDAVKVMEEQYENCLKNMSKNKSKR